MRKLAIFKSIHGIILIVIFLLAMVTLSPAESSLKPLLINIEGWEADEADVVNVNIAGMKTITVTREYSKGNKEIEVSIVGGNSMVGIQGMTGLTADISVDDADTSERIFNMDGFQVSVADDKKTKSGEIAVYLSEPGKSGAVFTVSYSGMSENEAMSIAKKFNWKKIKSEVEK